MVDTGFELSLVRGVAFGEPGDGTTHLASLFDFAFDDHLEVLLDFVLGEEAFVFAW